MSRILRLDETRVLWLDPCTGATVLVPRSQALDAKDSAILRERFREWNRNPRPRVGDYVHFADGKLLRIAHDWGDYVQLAQGGSFYFGHGYCDYSGALYTDTRSLASLVPTQERLAGRVWFFHHDWWQAHNGVVATIPCRVYVSRDFAPERR